MDAETQVVELELSSAQLKSLVANPVTLLAAPGAGFMIHPLRMFLHYKFGTTAYADPGGASLYAHIGALHAPIELFTPLVTASEDQVSEFDFSSKFVHRKAADANVPVLLESNAGVDLTSGDGTLVVRLYYYLQSL